MKAGEWLKAVVVLLTGSRPAFAQVDLTGIQCASNRRRQTTLAV